MLFRFTKKTVRRPRAIKRKNLSYQTHKEAARTLIHARLEYFNQWYGLSYKRVAIRDQKRCWGSCSSKGNLNFSYKLLFLPPCLRDYVVLHELCHLAVLNHSASFWTKVEEVMPDCRRRAQTLRELERTYGTAVATLQKLVHPADCPYCVAVVPHFALPTHEITDFVVMK